MVGVWTVNTKWKEKDVAHQCESDEFICCEPFLPGSPLVFVHKKYSQDIEICVSYCPICGYKAKIPYLGSQKEIDEAYEKETSHLNNGRSKS